MNLLGGPVHDALVLAVVLVFGASIGLLYMDTRAAPESLLDGPIHRSRLENGLDRVRRCVWPLFILLCAAAFGPAILADSVAQFRDPWHPELGTLVHVIFFVGHLLKLMI